MNIFNKIKQFIYPLIAILIGLGVLFAIMHYQKTHRPSTDYSMNEIKQLSAEEQKKIFEDREKDFARQADKLNDSSTPSSKFGAYMNLAEARNGLGKYTEAISALDQIKDIAGANNARLWLGYAVAYKGLGDNAKAKENAQKALDIDDANPEVLLANLELNSDLPNDQLKALYLKAIPATKSNVDVMISYAKFSEKIGDKATAIAAWETARNVDPDNASKYESEIARLR